MKRTTVEARREEILVATCEVVVERGFGATRVADVAKRLGVSTGLIHYHFESKDQLFAEALAWAARADLARMHDEVGRRARAVERLAAVFNLSFSGPGETAWVLWVDGWGEAMRSTALKRISQELDVQWKSMIEEIIREGVAAGELHCADPEATAWRLTAVLDGLGVQLTVHEGAVTAAECLRWVHEQACSELGLPPGAFD